MTEKRPWGAAILQPHSSEEKRVGRGGGSASGQPAKKKKKSDQGPLEREHKVLGKCVKATRLKNRRCTMPRKTWDWDTTRKGPKQAFSRCRRKNKKKMTRENALGKRVEGGEEGGKRR